MTDVFSPEKRREIMRLVKSKNSKAELYVFRQLRKRGVYFQKHYKRAPGTPDIALPRKKLAVFIDGDFWHGRTFETLKLTRASDDYWVTKIRNNMKRDTRQEAELLGAGWKILRVWESDINRKKTSLTTLEKIEEFLTRDSK